MAQHNKVCGNCGELGHSKFYCRARKHKPIKKQSDKEIEYQEWKEEVARPFIIERDGNNCFCCGRSAYTDEKLDIEHEKGKGSHPELKRVLTNLRLFCRFPCHRRKTDGLECKHEIY